MTLLSPLSPLRRRPFGRRALVLSAAAASFAFALTACAPTAAPPGAGAVGGPDPVGTWGTVDTTGVPYLTFTQDGRFSGSDGCNNLTGGWELDGTTIDFEDVATTLMACEGVNTWLSALDEATISGTTMTILNDADKVIGTLESAN